MSNRFIELFTRSPSTEVAQSAEPANPRAKPVTLKPAELLELVNRTRPNSTKGIPEKQAQAFVSAVLSALGSHIESAGDTPVRVAGLGVFRSRDVEVTVNNESKKVRATGFRRLPAAAKKTKQT